MDSAQMVAEKRHGVSEKDELGLDFIRRKLNWAWISPKTMRQRKMDWAQPIWQQKTTRRLSKINVLNENDTSSVQ